MDADRVAAHDLVLPRASPALPPARRSYVGVVSLLVAVIGAVACRVALAYGAARRAAVAADRRRRLRGRDGRRHRRLVRRDRALPSSARHPDPAHRAHRRASRQARRRHRRDGAGRVALPGGDRHQARRLRAEQRDRRLAPRSRACRPPRRPAPRHPARRRATLDRARGRHLRRAHHPSRARRAPDRRRDRACARDRRPQRQRRRPPSRACATSIANLADRPRTAEELRFWLDRSAATLRAGGKRLVPMLLRRRLVQRKLVEAMCSYASAELRAAAVEADHPLRRTVFDAIGGFAERVARGDPQALKPSGDVPRDAPRVTRHGPAPPRRASASCAVSSRRISPPTRARSRRSSTAACGAPSSSGSTSPSSAGASTSGSGR